MTSPLSTSAETACSPRPSCASLTGLSGRSSFAAGDARVRRRASRNATSSSHCSVRASGRGRPMWAHSTTSRSSFGPSSRSHPPHPSPNSKLAAGPSASSPPSRSHSRSSSQPQPSTPTPSSPARSSASGARKPPSARSGRPFRPDNARDASGRARAREGAQAKRGGKGRGWAGRRPRR
jgi:hypothetical protein